MSDLVRVKAGGKEFNTGHSRAIAQGLQILEGEPVRDSLGVLRPTTRDGEPVRRKRRTSVDVEAAKKKPAAAKRAPAKKRPAAKKASAKKAAAAPAPADSNDNNPPS